MLLSGQFHFVQVPLADREWAASWEEVSRLGSGCPWCSSWHSRSVLPWLCAYRDQLPDPMDLGRHQGWLQLTPASIQHSSLCSDLSSYAPSLGPAAAVKPGLIPGTFSNIHSQLSRLCSCASAQPRASTSSGSLLHPSPQCPAMWEWWSGDHTGPLCPRAMVHSHAFSSTGPAWSAKASSSDALENVCL